MVPREKIGVLVLLLVSLQGTGAKPENNRLLLRGSINNSTSKVTSCADDVQVCGDPKRAKCVDDLFGGGIKCICQKGYTAETDENGNFVSCQGRDECTLDSFCDDPLRAYCVDADPPLKFRCHCRDGYFGTGYGLDSCLPLLPESPPTPIDECLVNMHSCDANATCIDTPLSYNCTCNSGFEGNGFFCDEIEQEPTPIIDFGAIFNPLANVLGGTEEDPAEEELPIKDTTGVSGDNDADETNSTVTTPTTDNSTDTTDEPIGSIPSLDLPPEPQDEQDEAPKQVQLISFASLGLSADVVSSDSLLPDIVALRICGQGYNLKLEQNGLVTCVDRDECLQDKPCDEVNGFCVDHDPNGNPPFYSCGCNIGYLLTLAGKCIPDDTFFITEPLDVSQRTVDDTEVIEEVAPTVSPTTMAPTAFPTICPANEADSAVSFENFEDGVDATWSNAKTASSPAFTTYLGNFGQGDPFLSRTFSFSPGGDFIARVIFQFDFLEIDSWDGFRENDKFLVGVETNVGESEIVDFNIFNDNDNTIGGFVSRTTTKGIRYSVTAIPSSESSQANLEQYPDQVHKIVMEVPQSFFGVGDDIAIKLTFQNQLNGERDEFVGIDNVRFVLCIDQSPSSAPSAGPSPSPSFSPTDVPSVTPSISPSGFPSIEPSEEPSPLPSDEPSWVPSGMPSGSSSPSEEPSWIPSSMPSGSSSPSGVPSS